MYKLAEQYDITPCTPTYGIMASRLVHSLHITHRQISACTRPAVSYKHSNSQSQLRLTHDGYFVILIKQKQARDQVIVSARLARQPTAVSMCMLCDVLPYLVLVKRAGGWKHVLSRVGPIAPQQLHIVALVRCCGHAARGSGYNAVFFYSLVDTCTRRAFSHTIHKHGLCHDAAR